MPMNPPNPKDAMGSKKVSMGHVCPVAIAHESCAMLDGDLKYGFRNWRESKVVAHRYIDAALRHLNVSARATPWLTGLCSRG